MQSEVAFLVYDPLKARRKDNSFDGNQNTGARLIKQIVERAGIPVGFCSAETANEYRVVLVSFTSNYDMFAFYRAVALLPFWQRGKRTFRVVAGGAGMQNPVSVRNFVDAAAFGRAETFAARLVQAALDSKPFDHPSVMHLPDIHPVEFCQASEVYPNIVGGWQEAQIGCPHKCAFCHYTWGRKRVVAAGVGNAAYLASNIIGGNASPEVTWRDVGEYAQKFSRITGAIDGSSERLRFAVNKVIRNEEIVNAIETAGSTEGTKHISALNVVNYPTETDEDRKEIEDVMRKANPKNKVVVVLRPCQFRPSVLTPMQWEPVSIFPATCKKARNFVARRETLTVIYSGGIESPWSHLEAVLAERALPTKEFAGMFHAICFASKLQSGLWAEKVRRLQANFDIKPYVREYDFDEKHPCWFLRSYTDPEDLKKAGRIVRRRLANG